VGYRGSLGLTMDARYVFLDEGARREYAVKSRLREMYLTRGYKVNRQSWEWLVESTRAPGECGCVREHFGTAPRRQPNTVVILTSVTLARSTKDSRYLASQI